MVTTFIHRIHYYSVTCLCLYFLDVLSPKYIIIYQVVLAHFFFFLKKKKK